MLTLYHNSMQVFWQGLLFTTAVILTLTLAGIHETSAEVRQGIEITIAEDEVIEDDVYVFAQEITVNGTIRGDLIACAQRIKINGVVEGDVIASAQKLAIVGKVKDDVRIAGQVLTLGPGSDIGDDLVAAGYSLECDEASHIAGEVKFAGYQSLLAGRVERKVSVAAANCQLTGFIGEDFEAIVDGGNYASAGFWADDIPTVPSGLSITKTANVAGKVVYQSTREADISPVSRIEGEVDHTKIESEDSQPPTTLLDHTKNFLKQYFACLIVGLLVVCSCPKWVSEVTGHVQRRPIASLAWGILTLIAVITGVILLLVATIAIAVLLGFISLYNLIPVWLWIAGLSTVVLVVGFWIFSAWVTKVIVAVWAGTYLINSSGRDLKQSVFGLALGLFVLGLLSWIPVAGAATGLLVMLTGTGSTMLWTISKPENINTGKQLAR